MDGVKFRHYPDSTVTKQGKRWHFADIDIIDGTYVLEDKFARWVPSE